MNNESNNIKIDVLEGFNKFQPSEVQDKNYVTNFFKDFFYSSQDPSKLDYTKVFIFVLILAFLGFNIFSYLGDIVAWFKKVFGPLFKEILSTFGIAVTDASKQTLDMAAEGTKAGVDIASGTLKSTINVLEGQLDHDRVNLNQEKEISQEINKNVLKKKNKNTEKNQDNEVEKLRKKKINDNNLAASSYSVPEYDDSLSKMQTKPNGKSGYCYIGEDRGFRSCIKVGQKDVCMSGDIFPSRDICINPNLRE